jgi:NAD(P)-dependent dehydrogenase (short-subunit alcohol dehydrogenase family)
MAGKAVVITGASSGIGRETARGLAAMGARIVMVLVSRFHQARTGRGRQRHAQHLADHTQRQGHGEGRDQVNPSSGGEQQFIGV